MPPARDSGHDVARCPVYPAKSIGKSATKNNHEPWFAKILKRGYGW